MFWPQICCKFATKHLSNTISLSVNLLYYGKPKDTLRKGVDIMILILSTLFRSIQER